MAARALIERIRNRVPSPVGRILRRLHSLLEPYALISYAQEGEDMVLRRLLDGAQTGFYVDVGAHHPKRFSNTYYFYQRGWRGINIEPNPDMARLLMASRPRDINIQAGVSDCQGTLTYYRFSEPALNTFDPEVASLRKRQATHAALPSILVQVRPLASILDEHLPGNVPITFLSVDTEGHDLAVLASNDWRRFRPAIVLAEAIGTSLLDVAQHAQTRYLAEQGYVPVAKTGNTVIFCGS